MATARCYPSSIPGPLHRTEMCVRSSSPARLSRSGLLGRKASKCPSTESWNTARTSKRGWNMIPSLPPLGPTRLETATCSSAPLWKPTQPHHRCGQPNRWMNSKLIRWQFSLNVHKTVASVLILSAMLLCGCATTKKEVIAVTRGQAQIPQNLRPIVLLNVCLDTDFKYSAYLTGISFVNTKSGRKHEFLLEENIFLKGSRSMPARTAEGTTYSPMVISLPPGEYRIHGYNISSATMVGGGYLDPFALVFDVKNDKVDHPGTLQITLRKGKATVAKFLQGAAFGSVSVSLHAEIRPSTTTENAFAIKVYPFLRNYIEP